MPKSLFAYTWKHSKARQFLLLGVTLAAFPLVYLALEAPKRIVNDAIGGERFPVTHFDMTFDQLEYLALWCGVFLFAVIASGLIKMQLNIMKGALAERLLRRLRYELIERIHRFPLPRFRKNSQGELVSIVTAETEPLGGLMGNLLAEPVFQAGQMLTILLFLSLQNIWFAAAACSLIPIQAYLIPMLQRRINHLNKGRIKTVRTLSRQIGESVNAMPEIRINNAYRLFLAHFSSTLHEIFDLRLRIYTLKFFMKFLNNFINHLTPLFFYAIGGYLVINGDMSLGALVAALAAFRDLNAPWRALLIYYNQVLDVSLRYQSIVEQFSESRLLSSDLISRRPKEAPSLKHSIAFRDVTVLDDDSSPLLRKLDFKIAPGSLTGVECLDGAQRALFVDTLCRLRQPSSGAIFIADKDFATIHQEAIARRIGLVSANSTLFVGTVGLNFTSNLSLDPPAREVWTEEMKLRAAEADRAGNISAPVDLPWLSPQLAGCDTVDELIDWWLRNIEMVGADDLLMQYALDARVDPNEHHNLSEGIVGSRSMLLKALEAADHSNAVVRFNPNEFHPGLTLFENLVFGVLRNENETERDDVFQRTVECLDDLGHTRSLRSHALGLIRSLDIVFADVGPLHPAFMMMPIDAEAFQRLAHAYRDADAEADSETEQLLVLASLTFRARLHPTGITNAFKELVISIRKQHSSRLMAAVGQAVSCLRTTGYVHGLSVLENALQGIIVDDDKASAFATRTLANLLEEADLKGYATLTVMDVPIGRGAPSLPLEAREQITYIRAVANKPDILVLDRAFASQEPDRRVDILQGVRTLLPDSTIIVVEDTLASPEVFDQVVTISEGTVRSSPTRHDPDDEHVVQNDLTAKIKVLRTAALFEELPLSRLRLIAFAANWFSMSADSGDTMHELTSTSVYIVARGEGDLTLGASGTSFKITAGCCIGDRAAFAKDNNRMQLRVVADITGLRISSTVFNDSVCADPVLASKFLQYYATNPERLISAPCSL